MVLCAAWDYKCLDKHDSLPLKFGFAVTALAIPGAQFAGCSINPARSFGPALVTGHWENHWVSTRLREKYLPLSCYRMLMVYFLSTTPQYLQTIHRLHLIAFSSLVALCIIYI
ncbi:aquaporin TIP1-2-like [Diaphorina citri]|uniref:Aquaporin TIP1-2-like n=1 Tax=Diaphorina citri TaxID=121845 RepID=A0A3Q0J8B3_DIACI|nr:aquaporin TIP1-2-like [Diaphorina citri]